MLPFYSSLTNNIKWLAAQSIFVEIDSVEIHRWPLSQVKNLAKAKNISIWEIHQILHTFSLALLENKHIHGFLDVITLKNALPKNFFQQKLNLQISEIKQVMNLTKTMKETPASKYANTNPYVIFWAEEVAVPEKVIA
ncbi:MAG: hypothetical protein KKA19_03635 [Candidatus Margulisbacteria bacterium]|nr:hypothetical protein [Candidatus Margulisiibacteriota bacterium]